MRIPRDLLFALGGLLLLSLDARAVQQAQTAPQTGSATGAATLATPVTTLPNTSGAGMAPEEFQAKDQQDKAMLPEDANDDQTMVPENATDTPAANPSETAPAPATPETPEAPTATPTSPASATPAPAKPAATDPTSRAPTPTAPSSTAPTNTAAAARQGDEGCWARLYDAENFIGHNVMLAGAAEMPDMEGTFRSIEIGPNATVITFSEENFADENGRFAAGARVANMREPGISDEFESLRLTCVQPAVR